MGSNQSRNRNRINYVQNDIEIIITAPQPQDDEINYNEQENDENDDEFYDCELISSLDKDSNDEIVIVDEKYNELKSHDDDDNNNLNCENSNQKQTQLNVKSDDNDDDDDEESSEERKERQRRELEEFRKDLKQKRELCQNSIINLRLELTDLREKYAQELLANEQLREMMEQRGINNLMTENKNLKIELAETQMFLQTSNTENINATMENQALREHVRSLKEVIKATKEMLAIREIQVNQLKTKLSEIEANFAEKEVKIMSTELQQEYQRQLEKIRNMRELYEERANLLTQERNDLKKQLDDKEHDLQIEIEKSKKQDEHIGIVENNLKLKIADTLLLENEISQLKSEKSQILAETNAMNQLLSQVLFDFNASGNKIDLEKLHNMLEQNRSLLNEMTLNETYEGIDESSFLPKLLYDLFLQVNQNSNEDKETQSDQNDETAKKKFSTPEEIASRLPKVWRVLIEFLNHNKSEENVECSVDEAQPQSVISVSKTFIKLRDLILQKRSLQRDTARLKTLYFHLEQRLDKQEKRLSATSLELSRTWHVVGKIKRQHRQLHTHEQILCYQLQQKRRLLNELKADLEYCRKKWALARALNTESEEQCRQMREEFSLRKFQDKSSAESGYSDELVSDEDDCKKEENIKIKIERFNKNLLMFDRTVSPTYEDSILKRRASDSILFHDFANPQFTRAQSEPALLLFMNDNIENNNIEIDDFEMLIPSECTYDDIQQASLVEQGDEVDAASQEDKIIVKLPPKVHEYDTKNLPKVKTKLKKSKKHKKSHAKNRQTESAEEMYKRLMRSMNDESSTCSTTTIDDDEEEIENIEEIPIDSNFKENSNNDSDIAVVNENETVLSESQNDIGETSKDSLEENNNSTTTVRLLSTEEEYLQRREIRLARLEAEAKEFYEKMTRDKEKRLEIEKKLTSAHQSFLDRQKSKKNKSKNKSSESCSSDSKNSDEEQDENENK